MMACRIFYWQLATRKRTSYHKKRLLRNVNSTMKDQMRETPLSSLRMQKHPQEGLSRTNRAPEMVTITRLRHICNLTNYTEQRRSLKIRPWKAIATFQLKLMQVSNPFTIRNLSLTASRSKVSFL